MKLHSYELQWDSMMDLSYDEEWEFVFIFISWKFGQGYLMTTQPTIKFVYCAAYLIIWSEGTKPCHN